MDRENFRLPNSVSVKAESTGKTVFDIFESSGPSTLLNDNWFLNGEAQMFVDKDLPVIVDIEFVEPVFAWGATFQRADTNELVQLKVKYPSSCLILIIYWQVAHTLWL